MPKFATGIEDFVEEKSTGLCGEKECYFCKKNDGFFEKISHESKVFPNKLKSSQKNNLRIGIL
jgi:hypothetical protein